MRLRTAVLVIGAVLSTTAASAASITISVFASSAPNAFGSPSFDPYAANAITGLENGGVSVGLPSLPTFYENKTVFTAGEAIVTDYNSWKGAVGPLAPPYNNELGNRLHFGLAVVDTGGTFSLSQLNFSITSSDVNSLGFAGSFNAGDVYSLRRVGINCGADGVCGTSDDIVITSGAATQLVNELYYVGVGNAYCSSVNPADCGGSAQTMGDVLNYIGANGPIEVTGRYWLSDGQNILASGSETVEIDAVPEPGTMLLLGTGLVGVASAIRRRYPL